jgi:hypothetical protein
MGEAQICYHESEKSWQYGLGRALVFRGFGFYFPIIPKQPQSSHAEK